MISFEMLFDAGVLNDVMVVDSENVSGNEMFHGMTVDDNSGRICLGGILVAF